MHVIATSAAELSLKAILHLTTSDLAHVVLILARHVKQIGSLSSTARNPRCKVHFWLDRNVSRRRAALFLH